MKIRYFLFALAFTTFVSCNSSSDKKENKEDTSAAKTDHDMTNMNMGGTTVADLPAVPDGAKVLFKNLKEGAEIKSPFKLEMGVQVMKIDTAGPVVAGYGHHHLFIDAEDSLASGTVIPKDSTHVHFGKGQAEYMLNLSPGKHKLTLQMADGAHRSYGSRLATTINITVKK